ncbi:unnamed protein product [Dibothriocephalus latus]|uniref:Uncharacterized protein n=1 Tax=Dibothriocephalus latus TaxID=60516 RepID=A0A3P6T081_DIBLA|nr:unnamed protein product [Dibothriocephalus latus]
MEKLSCGTKCIKYTLQIFNALVFILGGVILGFGIYFVVEAEKDVNGLYVGVPAFILTVGALVFLLGFLGCCGAWKENVCLLRTVIFFSNILTKCVQFAAIIIILLIAEIIGGILVFVYRHKFVDLLGDGIADTIKDLKNLSKPQQEATMKTLNELQEKLECCGGHNSSDWSKPLPSSCCEDEPTVCLKPYKQGCAQAMYDYMKQKSLAMGIILFVMAVLELGAIISACCLAKKLGEYEKLECCGGHGASDWGTHYPPSCCENEPNVCTKPYDQGCAQAMYDYMKQKSLAMGIILFVMAVLELGAIISACCLAKKLGEYEKGCAQAMYEYVKQKSLAVGIILFIMAVLQLGAIIAACCLAQKLGQYEKV